MPSPDERREAAIEAAAEALVSDAVRNRSAAGRVEVVVAAYDAVLGEDRSDDRNVLSQAWLRGWYDREDLGPSLNMSSKPTLDGRDWIAARDRLCAAALSEHPETGEREAIPAYFRGATTERRLLDLARAVVSMTYQAKSGTFGEQWREMAKLSIRELDAPEPLQDGGERSVRDELRAAAVEWERTRQECMPCEREFFDFLGDWLESPNERFSRLAEDGEDA